MKYIALGQKVKWSLRYIHNGIYIISVLKYLFYDFFVLFFLVLNILKHWYMWFTKTFYIIMCSIFNKYLFSTVKPLLWFKRSFLRLAFRSIFYWFTWDEKANWKRMKENSVNNIWIKGSQNYMDKTDYSFYKSDKEMNLFCAISQIVTNIMTLLSLNIKYIDL